MVIVLAANVVNALANWVLVYGNLGAPALGVTGSGMATSLSNLFQFVCIALYVRNSRFAVTEQRRPTLAGMRQLLRIGLPMGMHQALEVGIFALAAILMNFFGAVPMAAHQIAIQLASCSFMVAVGCSVAAATRVGQALGRGDVQAAERAGWLSIAVGVGFMAGSALFFLSFNEPLIRLFTDDAAVIVLGASLLKIAGAFQLSDGIQAVTSGALRGAGDTKFSLYASLTGYWLVGLPLCGLLGFYFEGGPKGLWWALVAALTVTALILLARFRNGGWKTLGRL
jgi:MATE family multidrug resistance protein